MNIRSLAVAFTVAAPLLVASAHAGPIHDPRIAINAVNTPGDGGSLFRITAPGSYYLEAPLTGVLNKCGIEIDASDVHVDLMGFSLRGVAGSAAAIRALGSVNSITVRNGTLSNWPAHGIQFPFVDGAHVRVLVLANVDGGGIQVAEEAVIERCSVRQSGGFAIWTARGSLISDCVVNGVAANAMGVGEGSTVRNCIVRNVDGVGIALGSNSSVLACNVSNATTAIHSTGKLLVVDCNLSGNTLGVRLQTGAIRGCTITGNTSHGIETTGGVQIVGNHVAANTGDGIRAQSNSRVEDNDVRTNGGAGVRVIGAGSYVVKNTLTGNGSTLIVPNSGNFVGTLVHANGLNGRNDPWANIHSN